VNLESDHKITLRGRTLGVIGVGNVGTKVARVGKAFGMRVLLNDPPRARKEGCADFVTLEHLLEQSDVVTLHVPLEMTGEDATYHLADDRFFSRMREGAVILNSSRGEVVDPGALERAIRSGSITASVIDVWENEPDIDPTLLNLVTYATPHIAGYSLDGKANGTSMIVQALSRRFGLGLDEWHPESLPVPPNGVIVLDTMEPNASRAVATAVNTSYDIRNDDRRLRADPASFEKQRGDYPLRREFPAFSVRMKTTADTGDSKVISDTLKGLGFRML
jgi:erythronate-4-phosphate dehydrogenase